MPLVALKPDYTSREAGDFVSGLATRLVRFLDLPGVLVDIQGATALDEDALQEILTSHFEAFSPREDEEILEWVISCLID